MRSLFAPFIFYSIFSKYSFLYSQICITSQINLIFVVILGIRKKGRDDSDEFAFRDAGEKKNSYPRILIDEETFVTIFVMMDVSLKRF